MSACRYNLILVSNPHINERWDFELVGKLVRELAPEIRVLVVDDAAQDWARLPGPALDALPTLTFSPARIRHMQPPRGSIFQGLPLHKQQEYQALERAAVAIPRWALLTRQQTPELADFGAYVVVKPDRGGRGADVTIQKKGRVRWRPPKTGFTKALAGENCDWIVQDFVYTGAWPVSYRVATLFGEPIWGWRVEADCQRLPLSHRHDFPGDGKSIVASGKGSVFSVFADAEIFALAKQAHRGFPQIPLLGVDVLRDAETGALQVIEVNAVGFTWHLTSPVGSKIQQEFGFDLDAVFHTRSKAARLLVEQVRRHAC